MLGNQLKKCRLAAGMTQQQLADKLNLSRSAISKYERNIVNPNIHRRVQIFFHLKASADFLLDITDDTSITDTTKSLTSEEAEKITVLINEWFFHDKCKFSLPKTQKIRFFRTAGCVNKIASINYHRSYRI